MKRKAKEIFRFLAWGWSVEAAQALVKDGREPDSIDVAKAADLVGAINRCEPTVEVDLSVPLIAIRTAAAGVLPIDGYNRMAKALAEGVVSLPCHILSSAEEREIRMMGCRWAAFDATERKAEEKARREQAERLDAALAEIRAARAS